MRTALIAIPVALLVSVLSLRLLAQNPPSSTASTIRFISQQRLLGGVNEAKAEFARAQRVQQEKLAELKIKQQELAEARERLASTADGARRQQLLQEETRLRTDLEQLTAQVGADLQTMQRELQATLQPRLRSVLDEVLKGQDVQLVLNADTSVVWAASGMDITSQVIERWNAQTPAQP